MKVIFIFNEPLSGAELRESPLGGISTSIIMLAEAFVRKGLDVIVYNTNPMASTYEGVRYERIPDSQRIHTDLAIVNNSAKDLWKINYRVGIVWQHNRTSFSKVWKRGELLSLLIKRPELVVLSHDAKLNTPKIIPYRKTHIIPHAIEPLFMRPGKQAITDRPLRAIFASRASRNLSWVIDVWKQYIHPKLPKAEFIICTPPGSRFPFDEHELATFNIFYKGSVPKQALAELLNTCRVLAYPGHINETGCQVALQAIGMGIPIVTCGHGSLKDLVEHAVTGYVETDRQAYADRLITLFTNPERLMAMQAATLKHPWRKGYDERVTDWLVNVLPDYH